MPEARHVLAAGLLASLLSGCGLWFGAGEGEVSRALVLALRERNSEPITLAELTRFPWDELLLFAPYTPQASVCQALALSRARCALVARGESSSDGEMLMVFREAGQVVHSEMHLRSHGDFLPLPDAHLTPATAVFDVVQDGDGAGGQPWLRLRVKGGA
ncbi:hypothetical protein [Stutzerimonas azotifigens]|uniref:Lipoprotein n=1 Tax=Stutzerimonas azotifigens TaxID=291995 RepID=A0ABR5YZ97_9GAMM|nr:hypothetical protein [Stutzerimonas azotifigens]MBA1273234.1 hypothetical protein [Stutzerimonas azotifigens]